MIAILATAERNKKLGCIDTTGREVIPIKYDDIGFWGNNLIPVNIGAKERNYLKSGGKWGYCNNKGVVAIPVQFNEAETFHEGIAAVRTGNKWGFIDTTGKIIIDPKYEKVRLFSEGRCAVSLNNKWGYINRKGEVVVNIEYGAADDYKKDVAAVFVGQLANEDWEDPQGNYCLINKNGERITEPIFQQIWKFSEGLAKVEIANSADKYATKKGFINTKGKMVVPAIYDKAEDFSEGLAVIGISSNIEAVRFSDSEYIFGYVNADGKEIIPARFDQAHSFINGKAVVGKGRKMHSMLILTDTTDNSIVNYQDHPKYALIDKQGKFLLDFEWGWLSPAGEKYYIAQRTKFNGSGVIDESGKTIVPFNYTNLESIGNNLFVANDGNHHEGEVQLISLDNKILFRSTSLAMPAPRYEFGLIHVRTNHLTKSGFIDTKGNWIIRDKYDMVWDFVPTSGNK
ncbi:WG repeat-containing protein [Flavihumibacter petaseus]|nr:WG repeat-containing protein [Flavihumibacter petaseus]